MMAALSVGEGDGRLSILAHTSSSFDSDLFSLREVDAFKRIVELFVDVSFELGSLR